MRIELVQKMPILAEALLNKPAEEGSVWKLYSLPSPSGPYTRRKEWVLLPYSGWLQVASILQKGLKHI